MEAVREIEFTGQFKRDYKRELKGQHGRTLEAELEVIINQLIRDQALAPKCRDHALSGDWKDHRDCHVKPDLVLIYRKVDPAKSKHQAPKSLQLVRLGSHSELGL